MRPLLLTLTLAACGRHGFDAPAPGVGDDAAGADGASDDDAAPMATWVKACTGAPTHASTFDTFPPWAIVWRDPNDAALAVTLEAGTLRIDASPDPFDYAGIRSASSTMFRNRRITTEVLAVPGGSQSLFLGVDRVGGGGADVLRVITSPSGLRFVRDVGGVVEERVVPYDPVAHRYWQVREADGMTMLETSPDDVTYVTHLAVPTPAFVDQALLVVGMGSDFSGPGTEVGRFGSIEACPI